METFLIDVPMPSMGATVHELTVISLRIAPGAKVAKGQKVAELESDKSVFEFESPCEGTVRAIFGAPGDVKPSGSPFLQIETVDASLKHLESKGKAPVAAAAGPAAKLVWTPRAVKMAQDAGLIPDQVTDIEPTGPGSRVSGDDVARYLEKRK
jgi:pyruvate/2-oxoglutarate dehydrogenase complex dihydrolipoamide acyltransferase (E2) component